MRSHITALPEVPNTYSCLQGDRVSRVSPPANLDRDLDLTAH